MSSLLAEPATKRSKNPREQRRENSSLVLRFVRRHPGITRALIAEKTGLSMPSVLKITDHLVALNLLQPTIPETGKQRRVPGYHFRGSGHVVLGLGLGRLEVSGLSCDLEGRVLDRFLRQYDDPDLGRRVDYATSQLERILEQADDRPVLGLGISIPGPVDITQRRILRITDLLHWEGAEIGRIFEERLGLPVFIERKVPLWGFLEKTIGGGQGREHFLYVHLSDGINVGLVHDGGLFRVSPGEHGGLGHYIVDDQGPLCECGNRGCLETYAGKIALDQAIAAAGNGAGAREAIRRAADYAAQAVGNLINTLGFRTMIVGGRSIEAYPALFEFFRQILPAKLYPTMKDEVEVWKTRFDDRTAPALAPALWIAESALRNQDTEEGKLILERVI